MGPLGLSLLLASTHFLGQPLVSGEISKSPQTPKTQTATKDKIKAIDAILQEAFAANLSPGMSVAIVADGKIAYARGFGFANLESKVPCTPDTEFYIASTTKSFTAFACAALAQQGKVDLRAPITRYLPKLRFHQGIDPAAITLESLLTHTHGLDADGAIVEKTAYTGDFRDTEELIQLVEKLAPAESGKAFNYSNIGPVIASFVLEAVTGKSWKEVVRKEVLNPLGLRNTLGNRSEVSAARLASGYNFSPAGFDPVVLQKSDKTMHAAGGHYSTANDMAAWVGVHLNQGKWNGKRIFEQALIAKSLVKRADQDRKIGFVHRDGWALGWDLGTLQGESLVARSGGFPGYANIASFMPEKGIGVIVLANGGGLSSELMNHTLNLVYSELLEKPESLESSAKSLERLRSISQQARAQAVKNLAKRAERQKPLPLPLMAYTGTFKGDRGAMTWTLKDGKLWAQMGQLNAESEVMNAETHSLRFELFGNGQVVNFKIEEGKVIGFDFNQVAFKRVNPAPN